MSSERTKKYGYLVAVIDAGVSNIRFVIFSAETSQIIAWHQKELMYFSKQEGWLEQDPFDIMNIIYHCIKCALIKLKMNGANTEDIIAVGVTNQRETAILWDKVYGRPLYNAILSADTRTSKDLDELMKNLKINNQDHFQEICGLPLTTHFSALKVKWMIDNVPNVKKAIAEDRCLFGTVDTWILWNMLEDAHYTDTTNASRTMLMNIKSLTWDDEMLDFFQIPKSILPEITPSSHIFGKIHHGPLMGIHITGSIGNQNAGIVGQKCFSRGDVKVNYDNGSYIFCNTGLAPCFSSNGFLTTIAYHFGRGAKPVYAIETATDVSKVASDWLASNVNIEINDEICESLVTNLSDKGNVLFVPAFNGLYAPHWKEKARGTICGINKDSEVGHFVRAAMESICLHVNDIIDCMKSDCGLNIKELKVSGPMSENCLLMGMQANLGNVNVNIPDFPDIIGMGAALTALWAFSRNQRLMPIFNNYVYHPTMSKMKREVKLELWKLGIEKSLNWAE